MPHEFLESGQGNAGTNHVCAESMAEAMGIGQRGARGEAMVAEQRPESGGGEGQAAMRALPTDKEGLATGDGPLHEQVFLQHRDHFVGQRQQTRAATLAKDVKLGHGWMEAREWEGEEFRPAQSVEQHQTNNGQIAEGAETVPELADLLGRERLDDAMLLLQPQAARDDTARSAITEGGSLGIAALEMELAAGDLLVIVKAIEALDDDEAAIDGLGRRWKGLVELVTDIILKGG